MNIRGAMMRTTIGSFNIGYTNKHVHILKVQSSARKFVLTPVQYDASHTKLQDPEYSSSTLLLNPETPEVAEAP